MAGLNKLSEEDIQNVFRKLAEYTEGSGSGGLRLTPDLLEKLGIGHSNTAGARKAININRDDVGEESASNLVQMDPEGRRNRKSFLLLKEKARGLASRSKFYEASSLLEEVDDNEGISDLGTRLLMAECYLQLGRENRANKCLSHVEKSLKSNPSLPPEDLINLAEEFIEESSYIRAIIVLNIAADCILQGSDNPNNMLSGVYHCYQRLDNAVKKMLKKGDRSRSIAADMGMESMLDMYEKIRNLKGCDRDQQVLREARCCRHLDYNFSLLNEHKKCVEIATRTIKSLEDHFTPAGAQRFSLYGWLLHNLGVTLCNSQRFEESLAAHQKALEAKQQATDYASDDLRRRDIEETKKGLKKVRTAMGRI